jgi:ABC-type multidrug transport system ATPase subunit
VVILNEGRLAAQGKLSELRELRYRVFEMRLKGEEEAFIARIRTLGCRVEEIEDKLLRVYVPPELDIREIFRAAAEENSQVRHFVRSRTSLEDLFARAVGVD